MPEFDLGFLGGGQLARMSIQAAQRMGLTCLSLDPGEITPASQIAPALVGSLDDSEKIDEVFRRCAKVTLENEFIPAGAIRACSGHADQLTPGVETLAIIQDKLLQRQALAQAGVPSPKAVALEPGCLPPTEIGFPMVLKARFGGYDGKGTRYARTEAEFEEHRGLIDGGGWMAEGFVPFTRELAQMVVRTKDALYCFPTVETIQTKHVCDLVFPAWRDASEVAAAAIEAVHGYGLFGVELFEGPDGELLINEIAPRPHNTGHYTLDWGGPSQFDVHVRATAGLPIPNPVGTQLSVMANLLGIEDAGDYREGLAAALALDGVFVHWYGKAESRPGRKMGHLNVVGALGRSSQELVCKAVEAREAFNEGWRKK